MFSPTCSNPLDGGGAGRFGRGMRIMLVLLCLLAEWAVAQQAPYHQAPSVEAPYFRIRYAASDEAGELIFPVQYTIWIPDGVKTLRGVVVHQHGCGEGSCLSGQSGAFDLHWQALAKKHGCALLSPMYEQPQSADCQMWCDPRNGSARTFLQALKDLGVASKHPELATVPWALWGHSGGGHWAGGMTLMYPERVAGAWLRSGVPYLTPNPNRASIKTHRLTAAALEVPIMCNLGTKEGVSVKDGRFAGVWPGNEAFFHAIRSRGGLIGVAVDPLTSHECGNQRYLAIPWLDVCLTMRLPVVSGGGLGAMPQDDVRLAALLGQDAVPVDEFRGSVDHSVWLPNGRFAELWELYVRDSSVPDSTPPPAPSKVRVENGRLLWQAEADLESGLAYFIVEVAGESVAQVPTEPQNRYGRPLFQGLQYSDTPAVPLSEMRWDQLPPGISASAVRVIAVNTVGLHSE